MIRDVEYQTVSYLIKNSDEAEKLGEFVDQLREEGAAILSRDNMRGHITTSMFVLNHERTHGLMILHRHSGLWLQPGGHFEKADSLQQSALREVEEETGVRFVNILRLLPIDIGSHPISGRPHKGETDHVHHDFCYLGIAPMHHKLIAQEDEVDGVKWVSLEELETSHSRMKRLVAKVRDFINQ